MKPADTGGSIAASAPSPAGAPGRGPLRILAVGNLYPPQHAGGYELAWQHAMRRAREEGHEVRVLASSFHADPGLAEEDPGVHRRLRWYWDLERYRYPELRPSERLALERHNARELDRQIGAFRPHLVAWWSMGCMSLSLIERVRRRRIPAALIVHDDWLDYGFRHDQWISMWSGPRRSRAGRLLEPVVGIPTRVDVERAGSFVFNSRYTLEHARELGFRLDGARVVHPGIDERFLDPLPPRPWSWRLLYVGRIDRQKGIDTIVEALAKLPPAATLQVWGTGDEGYVAEMRELAARLGVAGRLAFRGFAGQAALRQVYGEADVVIFPVRWNEPFGLVPLEAMGVGRPVASTARGGSAEFIAHGENALVFEPGDAGALAAHLARLASDGALRARLLEGGRRTAGRFTAAASAAQTVGAMLDGVA